MDINLLAKMISELILNQDEVAVPGLGVFVAEEADSVFSDKGFTINPPYRRLALRQKESDDKSLIDLYARYNSVEDETEAENIIGTFAKGLAAELKDKKSIVLPGLGRLRATKQNNFFFVQEEYASLYPEGFGLESISLKSLSAARAVPALKRVYETPAVQPVLESEPVVEPEPEAPVEPEVDVEEPVVAEEPVSDAFVTPVPEPVIESEPEPEVVEEPAEELTEEPAEEPVEEPAEEPEPEPESVPEPEPETAEEPVKEPEPAPVKKKKNGWLIALLVILIAAIIFFAAIAIIGRVAPELIDPYLYSPEELELLK